MMPAPRADVDDVRIRRRDGDGADRAGRLVVEERHPVGAVVGRAPDAAVVEADVEDVRLARHAGQRAGAAGARRADVAPVHLLEREVLRDGGRRAVPTRTKRAAARMRRSRMRAMVARSTRKMSQSRRIPRLRGLFSGRDQIPRGPSARAPLKGVGLLRHISCSLPSSARFRCGCEHPRWLASPALSSFLPRSIARLPSLGFGTRSST